MAEKQRAYNEYLSAETEAGKVGLHSTMSIAQSFVDYVERYVAVPPSSVSTENLMTGQYSSREFFKEAMSRTFHVHWAPFTPPNEGPGNTLLVELRYDGEDEYTLRYVGFDATIERKLTVSGYFPLKSNSLVLTDGYVYLNIKRLNGTMVNGVNVWVHELAVGGRLAARYYLLPFEFVF